MIEIKNRWDGSVIYAAENAQDVRAAVLEAIKEKANLSSADLRSADLSSADLRSADLRSADLSYADLRSADLRSADLRSADLSSADLSSADLRSADLSYADLRYAIDGPSHPLWAFRQDYWSILDQAPGEVENLRKQIVAGNINGSVYNEGGCGCLNGTIAIHAGCSVEGLVEKFGIQADASRPAEQWFITISKGDKPLPLDTKEWPDESTFRISYALAWLDEWVESRTAIAKGLGFKKAARRKPAKKKAAK
jgi:hypothetical protein